MVEQTEARCAESDLTDPPISEIRRDSELGPLPPFSSHLRQNQRQQPWRQARVLPNRRNSTTSVPNVQNLEQLRPPPERPLRVSVCLPQVLNRQVKFMKTFVRLPVYLIDKTSFY